MSLRIALPTLSVALALGGCTLEPESDVPWTGPTTGPTTGLDSESSGDGDPTTTAGDGDGDGDPATTGDGDGEPPPTTGDGDGEPPPTTGDGDGEPPPTTGDGDGDGDCEGPSPYMGGWDIGCCQDQVAPGNWQPGQIQPGTVVPDWTFTDQNGDAVRLYDFCHDAIYFEYAAVW